MKMQSLIVKMMPVLLTQMSPALRDLLKGMLEEMAAKAKATDNPIDDVIVELVQSVLGLD